MKPPRRVENMLGVGFRHIYDALDQKINELNKKVENQFNTQNIKLTKMEDGITTEHSLLYQDINN